MELRHLRYFAAVAEELSFRRAAHRLHVSHPSLSQRITDLENELGMKLFKRNSRQVELTEAGRGFLTGVWQTLNSIQKAVAQAQEVAKGERGRLVIGNIGLLTQSFLQAALANFRERYPLVEVTVKHMNCEADHLKSGSYVTCARHMKNRFAISLPLFRSQNGRFSRSTLCFQQVQRCSKTRGLLPFPV